MKLLLIICMLFSVPALGADTLGRLFTTPAERASLDNQRQSRNMQALDQPVAATEAPSLPPAVSVQGYVKRSDGKKGTVWINQQPVQEGSATADVTVGKLNRDSNQVQLNLPAAGKKLKLKAGQVYVPETNSVSDLNTAPQSVSQDKPAVRNPAPAGE